MPDAPFHASLVAGEAVLRFPYDERLRQLLRAIPGRRWDPVERVWRVPLGQALALTRLIAAAPGEREVTPALTRALGRAGGLARTGQLRIDVVRPDDTWCLSFASDAAAAAPLLAHERARLVEPLGLALVPLDRDAAALLATLVPPPVLSDAARRGLESLRTPEPARSRRTRSSSAATAVASTGCWSRRSTPRGRRRSRAEQDCARWPVRARASVWRPASTTPRRSAACCTSSASSASTLACTPG